jgi:hypothetical protein
MFCNYMFRTCFWTRLKILKTYYNFFSFGDPVGIENSVTSEASDAEKDQPAVTFSKLLHPL